MLDFANFSQGLLSIMLIMGFNSLLPMAPSLLNYVLVSVMKQSLPKAKI
jgi:hypothetical protein